MPSTQPPHELSCLVMKMGVLAVVHLDADVVVVLPCGLALEGVVQHGVKQTVVGSRVGHLAAHVGLLLAAATGAAGVTARMVPWSVWRVWNIESSLPRVWLRKSVVFAIVLFLSLFG